MEYNFKGNKTIIWFSSKTGKALAPRIQPMTKKITASSIAEATTLFNQALETSVSIEQKRTIGFTGNIMVVDVHGKILETVPTAI